VYTGPISDAGAANAITLYIAGAGSQSLLGSNTYSGGTMLMLGGTLNITNDNNLGAVPAAATTNLTFATTAGGTLQIGSPGDGITVTLPATRTILLSNPATAWLDDNGNTLVINGRIVGTGGITKLDSGTLTLTASNVFSGPTVINAGQLQLANNAAAVNSTINNLVNNGLAFYTTNAFTIGGLAGAGDIGLTNDSGAGVALTLGGNNVTTVYSGDFNDFGLGGSLNKLGTGQLTLSGSNAYTGGTIINAGTLSVGLYTNLGLGAVAFKGGMLQVTGAQVTNLSAYGVAWGSFTGGFDIATVGNVFTITNNIAGGSFTKDGPGTLVFTATNAYTGPTTARWGTVTLGIDNALPTTTTLTMGNVGNISNSATLNLAGFSQTIGPLKVTSLAASNATATNTIINIATGDALNLVSATTGNALEISEGNHLRVTGAGSFNVNAAGGSLTIWGGRGFSGGSRGLDLSGLSNFTATLQI
jgi:autotransporter-associated beta strand protein